MADIFEIAGRIHSTSQEHVTSPADEILDTSQNKKQHLINSDVARHESEINSPTNGLNKRVADIEALGQIGDTPVETNASNIINNTSLSGKVPSASAVNGVYNAVVANAGYHTCDSEASTAAKVVEASGYVLTVGGCIKIKMTNANTADDDATLNINSTGAKALYYAGERASATNSWEEGETVEVYYDGTNFYANNVAGGSGSGDGAFDVSDKYPTSGIDGGNTYTLEGALAVLNANLSARKKKGGMSIKFVQSSDHKYVQYRYMGTATTGSPNPFLDTANWQGVDDEPTSGSDNLVKSGGVYQNFDQLKQEVDKAAYSGGDCLSDLAIMDEQENAIAIFYDGHIKTKNFDSAKIVAQGVDDGVITNDSISAEAAISGNKIGTLSNENFIENSINGEKIQDNSVPIAKISAELPSVEDADNMPKGVSNADFEICDNQGNCIERIVNGYPLYPNFNGEVIEKRITSLENIAPEDVYYAAVGDSITAGFAGSYRTDAYYHPIGGSPTSRFPTTYPYYIAKKYKLKWNNYGITGRTLIDCHVGPNPSELGTWGFASDYYLHQLERSGYKWKYISLFFGWNDDYYGTIQQIEIWLKAQYGDGYAWPSSPSKIGTDGYATQAMVDAVYAYSAQLPKLDDDGNPTETMITYSGWNYFKHLFYGNAASTDIKTWCGAWNKVLPYLMDTFPYAKILIILAYTRPDYEPLDEMQKLTVAMAKKYTIPYYDFATECPILLANNTPMPGIYKNCHVISTDWRVMNAEQYGKDAVDYVEGATYSAGQIVKISGITEYVYMVKESVPSTSANPIERTTLESTVYGFRSAMLLADTLHPNDEGYRWIAPSIGKKLTSI